MLILLAIIAAFYLGGALIVGDETKSWVGALLWPTVAYCIVLKSTITEINGSQEPPHSGQKEERD
jgi:hypothetical protein